MVKKVEKQPQFVNQEQWAEGMEMIQGFFKKLVNGQNILTRKLGTISNKVDTLEGKVDTLEVKVEKNSADIQDLKQTVQLNTTSIQSLTKEVREIKKQEFVVYGNQRRIKHLEEILEVRDE